MCLHVCVWGGCHAATCTLSSCSLFPSCFHTLLPLPPPCPPPCRGLIQDHVVSGTLLTKRDTFLTREEYMQLVYVACTPWTRRCVCVGGGGG